MPPLDFLDCKGISRELSVDNGRGNAPVFPPGTSGPDLGQTGMDAADRMTEELSAEGTANRPQAIDKIRYSHEDMIDFIIANPGVSQRAVARRYGYSEAWVSQVMSSDAWQSAMAKRRDEIVDPVLVATVEERFRGVTMLSLQRLTEKLSAPQVSDQVVLRAVELGAKAMGMGGNAPPPPAPVEGDRLERLAQRLIDLQAGVRIPATYVQEPQGDAA